MDAADDFFKIRLIHFFQFNQMFAGQAVFFNGVAADFSFEEIFHHFVNTQAGKGGHVSGLYGSQAGAGFFSYFFGNEFSHFVCYLAYVYVVMS